MSDEHVIPRSLGGTRFSVIRCFRDINSKLGSEVDAKIASDYMQFGRRDANAKGNSKSSPKAFLKNAAVWRRGDDMNNLEPRFTLEVPGGGALIKRYDTKTGKFLSPGLDPNMGYVIKDFPIDHNARMKFAVKTFIGLAWRLFGVRIFEAVDLDSLRAILGIEGFVIAEAGCVRYNNPFLIGQDAENNKIYREFEGSITQKNTSTAYIKEHDGFVEWTVSCLGYVISTIIVPLNAKLLPDFVSDGEGILLIFTKHGTDQKVLKTKL